MGFVTSSADSDSFGLCYSQLRLHQKDAKLGPLQMENEQEQRRVVFHPMKTKATR